MSSTYAFTHPDAETLRLWGAGSFTGPGEADTIRAALAGRLFDLAAPHVEHYRSDFYRDSLFINQRVNGPAAIYYNVRESGTAIAILDSVTDPDGFVPWREQVHGTRSGIGTASRGEWLVILRPEQVHENGDATWYADVIAWPGMDAARAMIRFAGIRADD